MAASAVRSSRLLHVFTSFACVSSWTSVTPHVPVTAIAATSGAQARNQLDSTGSRLFRDRRRHAAPIMKKPFKGGRLDDFIAAGEAEARYGPSRYAQLSEDAWKLEMDRSRQEAERKRSLLEFDAQKKQMLADHAFLSLLGCALMWSLLDLAGTGSYAVGAALGALYIYLQQRAVDSVGASSIEEVNRLPPPIVAPVLLVALVAKNSGTLELLPALAGFATNQIALVVQAAYPSGWGIRDEEAV